MGGEGGREGEEGREIGATGHWKTGVRLDDKRERSEVGKGRKVLRGRSERGGKQREYFRKAGEHEEDRGNKMPLCTD